jgi:hypothetical protein
MGGDGSIYGETAMRRRLTCGWEGREEMKHDHGRVWGGGAESPAQGPRAGDVDGGGGTKLTRGHRRFSNTRCVAAARVAEVRQRGGRGGPEGRRW